VQTPQNKRGAFACTQGSDSFFDSSVAGFHWTG
jgi:hypothetical protein